MSMRQTLDIVEALLEDDAVGLRSTVERLAASLPNAPTGDPNPPNADFNFLRAPLDGVMKPATRGNVSITPDRWVTNPRIGNDFREGTASLFVDFESTSASVNDLVDEATLVATAVAQCVFDNLREFSDAHQMRYGAVIVGVAPGVDTIFRYWDGPMTYGFRMTITVQLLSADD